MSRKGTYIDVYDRSFYKRDTPSHIVHKYQKLKKIDTTKDRITKTMDIVIIDMIRVGTNLGIPNDVVQRGINIFKKCIRVLRLQNLTHFYWYALASLFIAIRESGHRSPVTLQELHREFEELGIHIPMKRILNAIYTISTKLGIKHRLRDPRELVYRAIQNLVSSQEVQERLAKRGVDPKDYKHKLIMYTLMLMNLIKRDRHSLRPITKVAIMIYLADGLLAKKLHVSPVLTQSLIQKYIGVSQVSIRNYTKEYKRELEKLKIL